MSPHILLKREEANSLHWRLDKILLKKAVRNIIVVAILEYSQFFQVYLCHFADGSKKQH